jgi:hypothetical protein
MSTRTLAALTAVLIGTAACDQTGTISAPENTMEPQRALTSTSACPQTVNATWLGGVAASANNIAMNCAPDVCPRSMSGTGIGVVVDADGFIDHARFRCDDGALVSVPSTHSCWDCFMSCAASCPSGAHCSPIPNLAGSDCQAFSCPTHYTFVDGGILQPPYCRRTAACPSDPDPLTVSIEGPTAIVPGGTCTWTASATGGSENYSYTWYNENNWAGTGLSYTGGRPSGTLYPEFRLRVDVWDGSRATSHEIRVREDSWAMHCPM